ncbi:ATP-binding protein [Weissella cibaria]|nr:ATP-binding protein [Weissella cibaria]NFA03375.1 hypothetical protein [Weissella cibaria]
MFFGSLGVGKTPIAIALVLEAILHDKEVIFTTVQRVI